MRYLPKRARSVRFLLAGAAVGGIVLASAAIAIAAYPQDSVTVYTGCLNTASTSSGNLSNFAVGSNPAKPCGSSQMLIHLSGGTITKITAGTGLTGGGSDGYVTVGLDPKYSLPQASCAAGQFVASDGAGGWVCKDQKTYSGSDFALSNQSCSGGQFLTGIDATGMKQCADDQTYSNGTGLDLSGNTFSVNSGYQLPQGCSNGQVPVSNGSNTWGCKTTVGGLSTYENVGSVITVGCPLCLSGDTQTSSVSCNNGDIATGGGSYTDHVDQVYSNAINSTTGWEVQGSTGAFSQGHVQAYVICLHIN